MSFRISWRGGARATAVNSNPQAEAGVRPFSVQMEEETNFSHTTNKQTFFLEARVAESVSSEKECSCSSQSMREGDETEAEGEHITVIGSQASASAAVGAPSDLRRENVASLTPSYPPCGVSSTKFNEVIAVSSQQAADDSCTDTAQDDHRRAVDRFEVESNTRCHSLSGGHNPQFGDRAWKESNINEANYEQLWASFVSIPVSGAASAARLPSTPAAIVRTPAHAMPPSPVAPAAPRRVALVSRAEKEEETHLPVFGESREERPLGPVRSFRSYNIMVDGTHLGSQRIAGEEERAVSRDESGCGESYCNDEPNENAEGHEEEEAGDERSDGNADGKAQANFEDDGHAREDEADVSYKVEHRPVNPALDYLRQRLASSTSSTLRHVTATSFALSKDQHAPPPRRLCALVVHNKSLGYAWLDRSCVLVCGQTASSSLWGGSSSNFGWGAGAGGSNGRFTNPNENAPQRKPFFCLKRAVDCAHSRVVKKGRSAVPQTTINESNAEEEEAVQERRGIEQPPLLLRLPQPSSSLPKSLTAEAHYEAMADAAASIIEQVGIDAMPRWLFGDAFAHGGEVRGEMKVDQKDGCEDLDLPYLGDSSRTRQSSTGTASQEGELPMELRRYAFCPEAPATVNVVFPVGAEENAADFINNALTRAEARLCDTVGALLDARRSAIDSFLRKRRGEDDDGEVAASSAGGRRHDQHSSSNVNSSGVPTCKSAEEEEASRQLAISSFLPRFEIHFTPRTAFSSHSVKSSLQRLWPDVPPAGWACRLDLTLEALCLSVSGALHHVIAYNGLDAAVSHPTASTLASASRGLGFGGAAAADFGFGSSGAVNHAQMVRRVDAVAAALLKVESGVEEEAGAGIPVSGEQDRQMRPTTSGSTFLIADIAQHPGSGHLLHVDASTFDSLQVFRVESHPSAMHNIGACREGLSLYFLIAKKAVSPLGKELLRQWLAMPTCDEQTLTNRLDQVSFFSHIIANGGLQVSGAGHTSQLKGKHKAAAPSTVAVDLVGQLNKLLRRIQHPDYLINRVRLQRHTAADYRSLLLAATALLDVCKLLAPFASLSPIVCALVTRCQPDAARQLIHRISSTIDLELCCASGGSGGKGGLAASGGGGDADRSVAGEPQHKNGSGTKGKGGVGGKLSAADAPIVRGVSPQLDQLRDCYNSIDFDAFLAAAAKKEVDQLPPYFAARWKVSVAFMPHMGYLTVVDLENVTKRAPTGDELGGSGGGGVGGEEDGLAEGSATQEGNSHCPSSIQLPEGWEFVFRNTQQCFCRTLLTRELDVNIGDLHTAIREERANVLRALDDDIMALAHCLSAVRHVAEVDACLALAKVAVEEGWARPTLTHSHPYKGSEEVEDDRSGDGSSSPQVYCADGIRIEGGFHPLLSRATPHPVIPFDLDLQHLYYTSSTRREGREEEETSSGNASSSTRVSPPTMQHDSPNDDRRVVVLTGPHGSGKSVCQRAVALIALMAHIGSFVPAAAASVPLYMDRIICVDASASASSAQLSDLAEAVRRGGRAEPTAQGENSSTQFILTAHALSSSFGKELAAMCRALHSATNNSLLIVDEFGKGTLAADGIAILAGILSVLSDSTAQRELAPYPSSPLTEHDRGMMPTPPMCILTTHYTEIFEQALVSPQSVAWKHMAVLVVEEEEEDEDGVSPASLQRSQRNTRGNTHVTTTAEDPSPSRSMLPSIVSNWKTDGGSCSPLRSVFGRLSYSCATRLSTKHNAKQLIADREVGPSPPCFDRPFGEADAVGGRRGRCSAYPNPMDLSPRHSLLHVRPHIDDGRDARRRTSERAQLLLASSSVFSSCGKRLFSPYGMHYLTASSARQGQGQGAVGEAGEWARVGGGFRHQDSTLASPLHVGFNSRGCYNDTKGLFSTRGEALAGYPCMYPPSHNRNGRVPEEGDLTSLCSPESKAFPAAASPFSTIRAGGKQRGNGSPVITGTSPAISHRIAPAADGGGGGGYNTTNMQSRVVCLFELESCSLEKMFRSALETARVAGVPPVILNRAATILEAIREQASRESVFSPHGQ